MIRRPDLRLIVNMAFSPFNMFWRLARLRNSWPNNTPIFANMQAWIILNISVVTRCLLKSVSNDTFRNFRVWIFYARVDFSSQILTSTAGFLTSILTSKSLILKENHTNRRFNPAYLSFCPVYIYFYLFLFISISSFSTQHRRKKKKNMRFFF